MLNDPCAALGVERWITCQIVSDEGVKVDPSKIQSMLDWPFPTTLKLLRGFWVSLDTIENLSKDMGILQHHLLPYSRRMHSGGLLQPLRPSTISSLKSPKHQS